MCDILNSSELLCGVYFERLLGLQQLGIQVERSVCSVLLVAFADIANTIYTELERVSGPECRKFNWPENTVLWPLG